MNKLTENLNIIQNLSNQPTENAEELKRAFDEAGNIIKDYLNTEVEPVVTGIQSDYVTSGDLTTFKNEINGSLEDIQSSIDEVIGSQLTEVNNKLAEKTSYGDLIVTQQNVTLQTDIQYGRSTKTATMYQSGYKPLAIVGTYLPYDYNQQWTLEQYRITSASNGSGTISVTGQAGKADGNKNYSVTVTLDILWVKIR